MPSVRDFRKTDVFLYFLHYLDEFRQRPFKQLMEERKWRFEEFDGARKKSNVYLMIFMKQLSHLISLQG